MNEEPVGPAPGVGEPSAPGSPPPPGPAKEREREPSLGEKLDNLLEVARTTPRAEIKRRLEEGRHWVNQWEEYWLDCAQPLGEVVLLNLQKVLELGGNFYAAPGARRCGKTTLLQILGGLSECFSTPEKPLPNCWYLDGLGCREDFSSEFEKLAGAEKRELVPEEIKTAIEKLILEHASIDFDLERDEPGFRQAKEMLGQKEVIFLDEFLAFRGPRRLGVDENGRNLSLWVETLTELCPQAIIFATTGHALAIGSFVEDVFSACYETSAERGKVRMREEGLPDSWRSETAMIDFFGWEAFESPEFDFRSDPETFRAWLLNRLMIWLKGYGNPYIADQFCGNFNYERNRAARGYQAEGEVDSAVQARFERAIAEAHRLIVPEEQKEITLGLARKLLGIEKEMREGEELERKEEGEIEITFLSISKEGVQEIATKYGLDPDEFEGSINFFNRRFEYYYGWAITDVMSPEALIHKLQLADQAKTRLLAALLLEREVEVETPEALDILNDRLTLLRETGFSLRAKGAAVKHRVKVSIPGAR